MYRLIRIPASAHKARVENDKQGVPEQPIIGPLAGRPLVAESGA